MRVIDDPPTPPDPYLGRDLGGRYRVESFLGAGTMGRVYRATQRVLDRTVAVKILNANLCADQAATQRFLREAQAASRFDHPNSVAVFDFGQDADGTAFIAMEYLHGETLEDLLTRETRLPAARCVAIMAQVLAALSEAHEAGIAHRDVKPENVMLVTHADEDVDVVKVTDFGIAKLLDEGQSLKLTATGVVAGSPAYMSPEQGLGRGVDARSDLYQCGVVLYEMVTGRIPFEGDSAVAVIMQHLNASAPPPRSFNLLCPVALERVIVQAMEKEPARRFQTARAMRDALRLVAPDQVLSTAQVQRLSRPGSRRSVTPSLAPVPPMSPPSPIARRPPAREARHGLVMAVGAIGACALGMSLTLRSGQASAPQDMPPPRVRTPHPPLPVPPAPVAMPSPQGARAIVFEAQPTTEAPDPVAPAPTIARAAIAVAHRPAAAMRPITRPSVVAVPTTTIIEANARAAPPAPPAVEPVTAPPAPALTGVDGSIMSMQVTGGIAQGAVRGRAVTAAGAVARCVFRQVQAGGPRATMAQVVVQAIVGVRDRRADNARLAGSPLASGCRDALLGAFDGELPAGIDTEYEVRLTIGLVPRLQPLGPLAHPRSPVPSSVVMTRRSVDSSDSPSRP